MVYSSWKEITGRDVPSTSGFSEEVFKYLKPASCVLDVGCGYGRLSGFLLSRGYEVYGIDVNENEIAEAKRNEKLRKISFSVQDATNTTFSSYFFEGIISQAVLGCMIFEDRQKMLEECYRILKPNGVIQLAEFGYGKSREEYIEQARITGEYGTQIVRNADGSERYRTHNFAKEELEELVGCARLEIISYELSDFTSVNGNTYPGHIFLCRK